MPIPERFVDEVIARSEIAEVVGEYVSLNRKGGSLWGCCPFHSEKTPSFHVVPDRQMYKCFGCGKGGGVINFIMEIESLSFVEAVAFLAKRAGLQMPENTGESAAYRQKRQRLLELNKEAARFFHGKLYEPCGRAGLDYLTGRGLSKGTLTRFGLGYAPDSWDGIITAMAEKGYDKSELLEGGLVVRNQNGRVYDRFRNRVMFPIIDVRGEVIGFGGRVLDASEPKYLNSPDTPVYNKSRNLFALNIAKKSKQGRIILTEGYMDTISLHQAGFDCAVASLGTSLTAEHAQLISRYTGQAVIAYDGDGAGVAAAQRAIPILEKTGLKVKVLRVTGAKDPDEFIKAFGREAFSKLIDRSENHIEYRLIQLKSKYDLSDDGQKVEFLAAAAELVAGLQSPVEREIYGARAAEAAEISDEAMKQEVKRALSRRIRKEKKQEERKNLAPARALQPDERSLQYENIRSARAEEGVLRLMLLDPTLFQGCPLKQEQFSSPLLGKVYGLLKKRYEAGMSVQLPSLAEELTGAEMSHMAKVAEAPESLAEAAQALGDYISVIETEGLKRTAASDGDALLAAREKYRQNKAYGG